MDRLFDGCKQDCISRMQAECRRYGAGWPMRSTPFTGNVISGSEMQVQGPDGSCDAWPSDNGGADADHYTESEFSPSQGRGRRTEGTARRGTSSVNEAHRADAASVRGQGAGKQATPPTDCGSRRR